MNNFLGDYAVNAEHKFEPTVSTLMQIYEKLAYCNYEKHCAVTRMNAEALAPIFELLDTEDRKNIRLTCRNFKDSIDNFVGIHVTLDQRKIEPHLLPRMIHSMPPPGCSSIRLFSINNSKFLDHLLRRPHLIKVVSFAGQISLSAFTKITSRCMNLRKINFTDRSHLYSNIVPMSLHNLHTLDIGCPGYNMDYVGEDSLVPSLWLTYEILMRRLIAPNLKVLRIFFCCVEECSILHEAIAQVFRFLAVHDKVTELSINLHHRYERFNFLEGDVNYKRFRIEVPKKILRRLRLQKLHVETMEPAFKVWDCILPCQKHLTDINILNRGRRWFYFSKIISNNYTTLTSVRLHNISPKRTKTPVLDAGVFEGCTVLETLFLSRFENSTQEIVYCYPNENSEFPFLDIETSRTPEVENLTKLPVTLRQLHIQGLVFNSSHFCKAISNLRNLELLELQLTGYHLPAFLANEKENRQEVSQENFATGLGVTGDVIRIILQSCRKLETLFIEEFENSWTKVRNTELGNVLRRISHVAGDGYFEEGEYYGVLICSSVPRNSCHLTRTERMHLWGVRVSQYCHKQGKHKNQRESKRIYERDGVRELTELDAHIQQYNYLSETDNEDYGNGSTLDDISYSEELEPTCTTCLLDILDRENGKLEKIHRLINGGQTPPAITATTLKIQHTKHIAEEYRGTLFSAIPNYHKASRLQLDPTEKFSSLFSTSNSRSQRSATALKKMQSSQKLPKD